MTDSISDDHAQPKRQLSATEIRESNLRIYGYGPLGVKVIESLMFESKSLSVQDIVIIVICLQERETLNGNFERTKTSANPNLHYSSILDCNDQLGTKTN